MSQYIKYGALLVLFGFLTSCSKVLIENDKYPKKKDEELKASLDSLSSISFDYFYSKLAVSYKDSTRSDSFKTTIRIRKDSVVNAIITFVNIPVVSAQLTQDSIKMYNKQDKCYDEENLSFIKEKFEVDFSYKNVEELFVGMPVGYEIENKYFQINDPFAYTFCSHRKREIKKNERKDKRELITYYSLNSDLTSLKWMQIESPEDTATIRIDYKAYEITDGYKIPQLVNIEIQTPKKAIYIELDYKKTRVNETEDIYFVIPESYDKCK